MTDERQMLKDDDDDDDKKGSTYGILMMLRWKSAHPNANLTRVGAELEMLLGRATNGVDHKYWMRYWSWTKYKMIQIYVYVFPCIQVWYKDDETET